MRTVCIVQARLGSKRLPGKVTLPLNGHTVIGEVLTRCKRIPGVDEVVCAIPLGESELRQEAEKYCRVSCGPEDDVLRRYAIAAEVFEADIVMRITGDCPLISPELCGAVLRGLMRTGASYASNIDPRTFPRGLDCEVFTREMLEKATSEATDLYDREHVTPWMQRRSRSECRRISVQNKWPIEGRLCIDTEDDYKVIKAHFDNESKASLRAA